MSDIQTENTSKMDIENNLDSDDEAGDSKF
jgi:hypothetical protein